MNRIWEAEKFRWLDSPVSSPPQVSSKTKVKSVNKEVEGLGKELGVLQWSRQDLCFVFISWNSGVCKNEPLFLVTFLFDRQSRMTIQ